MKTVYKWLAFLVALEMVVQGAVMVWGIAGLGLWVDGGGVLDKATFENAFEGGETPFPEFAGLMLHGMNGMMIIPVIALLLLLASFFAKVPKGVGWAAGVVVLVALQMTLGLMGHEIPALGALHGANALLLFSTALWTGLRVTRSQSTSRHVEAAERVAV